MVLAGLTWKSFPETCHSWTRWSATILAQRPLFDALSGLCLQACPSQVRLGPCSDLHQPQLVRDSEELAGWLCVLEICLLPHGRLLEVGVS